MSKQFYIFLTVACVLTSGVGVFVYNKKVSEGKNIENQNGVMLEKLSIKKDNPTKKNIALNTPNAPVPEIPTSSSFTLLAFGDIMLDRSVMLKTQSAGTYEHPFLLIDPLLKEYDLHIANLEGPITTNKSVANGTGGARFTFTFSPNFVDPLKNRFEFLSLANNHAHNFGQKGLDQTREFLGDAGVKYFGGPDNFVGNIFVTSSYNGITLGFLGYHQLVEKGFENIVAEAKRLDKEVDVLIALPHWGTEYVQDKPTFLQTKEAHELIDAGVDLILGAHPHVVQPIEIYKEKVIFYSLGNFIFDQYFSEETMTGLAVGMNIEKINEVIKLHYKFIPLDINKQSQPAVAGSPKKEKVIDHLYKFSQVEALTKEELKKGEIQNQYIIQK